MSTKLSAKSLELKNLFLNPDLQMVDNTGRIKLIEKAQANSQLDALSPQKKFEEQAVCSLASYFKDFDQIAFSELDSYILVSNFSNEKIVEAFKEFVHQIEDDEDLVLKACVTRTIQHLQRAAFSYDYIVDRFNEIKELDPWLYCELVIISNWKKGIEEISIQLQNNYDSSYLFSLLPEWISIENNKNDISIALSEWYPLFTDQDKKIAEYYAENYGYKITNSSISSNEKSLSAIEKLIEGKAFEQFLHNPLTPNYKTLPTC